MVEDDLWFNGLMSHSLRRGNRTMDNDVADALK